MTDTLIETPAVWAPPDAVRVRGTLAVVAGSDEAPRVYERFGRRLAGDGYIVGVFETAAAESAAAWLRERGGSPRVLVGSDAGAAAILQLAVSRPEVADGLIVAALPAGAPGPGAASDRTACPVHLAVLADESARANTAALPVEIPDAASLAAVDIPVLAVHGGADPVAPIARARHTLSALPRVELIETVDGLHDALNDQSHRSVAAAAVLWLERLRGSDVDNPVIRVSHFIARQSAAGEDPS